MPQGWKRMQQLFKPWHNFKNQCYKWGTYATTVETNATTVEINATTVETNATSLETNVKRGEPMPQLV
jgi:hypothetical protein